MRIHPNLQRAIRLVIALVAIGLFVASLYNGYNYFRDREAKKEAVLAVVQKTRDSDGIILEYHFNGQTIQAEPVGKILHDYGTVGQGKIVYVETSNPKRVFLTEHPTSELFLTFLLLGWSILLGLIVWAEGRILKLLKIVAK